MKTGRIKALDDYISIRAAAPLLNISYEGLRQRIARENITVYPIPDELFLSKRDFEDLKRRREAQKKVDGRIKSEYKYWNKL